MLPFSTIVPKLGRVLLGLLLLGISTFPRSAAAQTGAPSAMSAPEKLALDVLDASPLVDGHNDLPWRILTASECWSEPARCTQADPPEDVGGYDLRTEAPGHTDIPRLREGKVGIQFWSVFVPYGAVKDGAAKWQLQQIDIAKRMIARYPEVFAETPSADEAVAAWKEGKIASVLGMEGGHAIENSLGALRAFYDLGVRYMTLTHSSTIDWADSATDTLRHDGLSRFGEEVVREMNRLGMLVDLSHVSAAAMHDALEVAEAPVIFSHSSVRGLTDHPRNVPDDVLQRLPENGGVVMITFVPSYVNTEVMEWGEARGAAADSARAHTDSEEAARARLSEWEEANPAPRATLADVADHIEYVRRVAGVDHVGIGGDYDGIRSVPEGLEDVSTYPALFAELARRGWTEAELRKLAGENVLRVWREAEQVAGRLRTERPASTATIEQ